MWNKIFYYTSVVILSTLGITFIIKGFRTIVFIFIVISTMFRPICPPALFSGICRTREPTQNFELRPLLNPRGSHILIPLAITRYKYSKFRGSRVRQTHEEGRRTYQPKRCENNNKDEDNSPKTLDDKNHQASSQKFSQLGITVLKSWWKLIFYIYIYIYIISELGTLMSRFSETIVG